MPIIMARCWNLGIAEGVEESQHHNRCNQLCRILLMAYMTYEAKERSVRSLLKLKLYIRNKDSLVRYNKFQSF